MCNKIEATLAFAQPAIDELARLRLAHDHARARPALAVVSRTARDIIERHAHRLTGADAVILSDALALWDCDAVAALESDIVHARACADIVALAGWTRHALARARVTTGHTDGRRDRGELGQLAHAVARVWSVAVQIAADEAAAAGGLAAQLGSAIVAVTLHTETASYEREGLVPGEAEALAIQWAANAERADSAGDLHGPIHCVATTADGEQHNIGDAWQAYGREGVAKLLPRMKWKPRMVRAGMAELYEERAIRMAAKFKSDVEVNAAVARLDALGLEDEPVVAEHEHARRGIALVIAGSSGVGKTSIMEGLIAADPAIQRSVSVTTRSPRPGEQEGVDYRFVTEDQFADLAVSGGLLEHATVHGASYGIPREPVERALAAGMDIVIVADRQGYRTLRTQMPHDVVGLFVVPPSARVLEERMLARGDAPESVAKRVAAAAEEMSHREDFWYAVTNDSLEAAIQQARWVLAKHHGLAERGGYTMWQAYSPRNADYWMQAA